jgi:hypothetical protein
MTPEDVTAIIFDAQHVSVRHPRIKICFKKNADAPTELRRLTLKEAETALIAKKIDKPVAHSMCITAFNVCSKNMKPAPLLDRDSYLGFPKDHKLIDLLQDPEFIEIRKDLYLKRLRENKAAKSALKID